MTSCAPLVRVPEEAPAEFGRSCVMRAREAVRGYAELDRHAKFFLDAHLLAQCSCSSWAVEQRAELPASAIEPVLP